MAEKDSAAVMQPVTEDEAKVQWYNHVRLEDAKAFIRANLSSAARSFIAIGYYLKHIRDGELFREDGHETIWDFAQAEYGISKSTASRYMTMNDRFSNNGNSPIIDDRYKEFEKSKLQEMLSLTDEQMEQVTPEMKVQEIRGMRTPREIPYFDIDGQLDIETDFPEVVPEPVQQMQQAAPQVFTMDMAELVGEESAAGDIRITNLMDTEEQFPDESYNIGSLPPAKESLLRRLARILVSNRKDQIKIAAFGRYASDEVIEEQIHSLSYQTGETIDMGEGIKACASAEIIEFFRGEEDLGLCTYARFATQVRKILDGGGEDDSIATSQQLEKPHSDKPDRAKQAAIDDGIVEDEAQAGENLTDRQIARKVKKKIELKPCPFCGGTAELKQFANPKNWYNVECTDCHCRTDGHRHNRCDGTDEENKMANAAVWNQRVN